jgi:hypothetical protein
MSKNDVSSTPTRHVYVVFSCFFIRELKTAACMSVVTLYSAA